MNAKAVVYIISVASVFLPLTLATIQWKKLPNDISLIRWVLISSAVCDIVAAVMGILYIKNWFVGDISLLIQFALILYILGNQLRLTKAKIALYATLVIVYGISLFLLEKSDLPNAFSGIVLIVLSILLFYKLINEVKVEKIQTQPIVWMTFAVLFYYAGTLFVIVAKTFLFNNGQLSDMWTIHNFFNAFKNILFAVALWQNYRAMKLSA